MVLTAIPAIATSSKALSPAQSQRPTPGTSTVSSEPERTAHCWRFLSLWLRFASMDALTFDSARRCAVQQFHVFYRSLTDTTSEQLQRRSRNRVITELTADRD